MYSLRCSTDGWRHHGIFFSGSVSTAYHISACLASYRISFAVRGSDVTLLTRLICAVRKERCTPAASRARLGLPEAKHTMDREHPVHSFCSQCFRRCVDRWRIYVPAWIRRENPRRDLLSQPTSRLDVCRYQPTGRESSHHSSCSRVVCCLCLW